MYAQIIVSVCDFVTAHAQGVLSRVSHVIKSSLATKHSGAAQLNKNSAPLSERALQAF